MSQKQIFAIMNKQQLIFAMLRAFVATAAIFFCTSIFAANYLTHDNSGLKFNIVDADTHTCEVAGIADESTFEDALTDGTFVLASTYIIDETEWIVVGIGKNAFRSDMAISHADLHNATSLTYISEESFNGCEMLEYVSIPSSLTSIGDDAFLNCEYLKELVLPESLTTIGESLCNGCTKLERVVIPGSVTTISNSAFRCCWKLTDVTLGEGIQIIGKEAFYDCSILGGITIPKSVTEIGESAFMQCKKLGDVTFAGNNLTTIGDKAFYYCSKMESISLPESLTNIGDKAFCMCSSLQECIVPKNVTSIGEYAFSKCYALGKVSIPDGVTTIKVGTFESCNALTDITLGEGVETIEYGVFNMCTMLESLTFPNSLKYKAGSDFLNCYKLKTLRFNDGFESITAGGLLQSSYTQKVVFPTSLTNLAEYAICNAELLETVVFLGSTVPTIGANLFAGCTKELSIYVPCGTLEAYSTALAASIPTEVEYNVYEMSQLDCDENVKAEWVDFDGTSGVLAIDGDAECITAKNGATITSVGDGIYTVTNIEEGEVIYIHKEHTYGEDGYCTTGDGVYDAAHDQTITAVTTLQINNENATITDLAGRRVDSTWSELPRGIYIVDGKKVAKK